MTRSKEMKQRIKAIEYICKSDMCKRYGPWIKHTNIPLELICEILAFSPQVPPHAFNKPRWVYKKIIKQYF